MREKTDKMIEKVEKGARLAMDVVKAGLMETEDAAVKALAPAYGLFVKVFGKYGELTNNGNTPARGEDGRLVSAIQKNVGAVLTAVIERVKASQTVTELRTMTKEGAQYAGRPSENERWGCRERGAREARRHLFHDVSAETGRGAGECDASATKLDVKWD